ncbi:MULTISPECIES: aspartyl-phosphate phosphatase Spo0E family protein [unclassified Paenibacillus]|uniref:aspartyl-phosphate phosphatase Spo0E family protein n=1 Tax=unclassified Paenibacillus TaxID=185978 RepID=UPI001E4AB3E5|nr:MULTISPECIES: aspartyl-phosphate phosphatase Spo0E family protein [unclassified Paenibacillus]
MICVENDLLISDANKSSSSAVTLEDEIQFLRIQMEQMVLQEQSFTSDTVIQISSLLDLKINEYMRNNPRK